jgi:hypothetical protein
VGIRSGEGRVHWSSGALLGFLLAFAFLGHDLFMAGGAHHATAAMAHESGHAGTQTRHTDGIAAEEDQSRVGTMAERDGCGYFGLAVPTSNDHGMAGGRHHAILGVVPIDPASSSAPTETAEPTAPPGVRRALLQVFRI